MDMSVIEPEFEAALVGILSQGLPLVKQPYNAIAQQLGCSESHVIDCIKHLSQRGDIKRFGVVVRHRKLGYQANAMVVWNVADADISEVGRSIGKYDFVTLCYQRPRRLPDWPYNLFCMIHGRNHGEVRQQVEFLVEQCALTDIQHEILFSKRCFKQRGASYSWQALHA
ncbi:MAG: Lrp/AsnC family transcriptional regulator [Gammaproteobacteria bacterium]|nr:Lrp/AsnC family transcriptional regulator [Gammaproteobacteria bacterium]